MAHRGHRKTRTGWRRTLSSFRYAGEGLLLLVRTEPNARIQLGLGGLAVALGLWLGLSPVEWAMVILASGLVLTAEAINTALEDAVDLVTKDVHPGAKAAKDLAAAGALLASLTAAGVGLLIYAPKLIGVLFRP